MVNWKQITKVQKTGKLAQWNTGTAGQNLGRQLFWCCKVIDGCGSFYFQLYSSLCHLPNVFPPISFFIPIFVHFHLMMPMLIHREMNGSSKKMKLNWKVETIIGFVGMLEWKERKLLDDGPTIIVHFGICGLLSCRLFFNPHPRPFSFDGADCRLCYGVVFWPLLMMAMTILLQFQFLSF